MVASVQNASSNGKPGLLLIEFQKTWTEKGIFSFIIRKQYESKGVLDNTLRVLTAARGHGVPVFQAPLVLDKEDRARYKKTPLPARLFKRFEKGTWKAEFTDGVFEEGDVVIQGRSSYDATIDSDLVERLNEEGVDRVYVGGFTTDHCVKDTMKSLIEKGFDPVMVSDCTATRSDRLQARIEGQFRTIDSRTLVDRFEKGI